MPTDPVFDQYGLITLRTQEIVENMIEALQASPAWGPETQVQADQALAQLIQIPADQIGKVYELVQALWDAWDPDTAPGELLDNLTWILGVSRRDARRSRVDVECTGDPNQTILAGSQARVPPNGAIWLVDGDIQLDGSGLGSGRLESLDHGPVEAYANTLTEVVTGSPPWSTVNNPWDAELGNNVESDPDLRLRRDLSLSSPGRSTDCALRAALSQLDWIDAATVISNRTMQTVDGIPPHDFEPVVHPPFTEPWQLERLAETIWRHTPSGNASHGTESATVTDAEGEQQTVKWSNATPIDIYWEIQLTTDSAYPGDGDDQVVAAVLAYGNSLSVGDDVLPPGPVDLIFPEIPGVREVAVLLKAGSAPGPSDDSPITITQRQVGDHDSSRITVVS